MTMTPQQREFLRKYVEAFNRVDGSCADMVRGVVATLADVALKEDQIRTAQLPPTVTK